MAFSLTDIGSGFSSFAQDTAQKIPVSLRTNLNASSPITLTPTPSTGPAGPQTAPSLNPTTFVMMMLQPEVVIGLPTGPITVQPYGAPTRDDLRVLIAALGLGALTLMGIGALIRIPLMITGIAGAGALAAGWRLKAR